MAYAEHCPWASQMLILALSNGPIPQRRKEGRRGINECREINLRYSVVLVCFL
jgi:hypothetical protein